MSSADQPRSFSSAAVISRSVSRWGSRLIGRRWLPRRTLHYHLHPSGVWKRCTSRQPSVGQALRGCRSSGQSQTRRTVARSTSWASAAVSGVAASGWASSSVSSTPAALRMSPRPPPASSTPAPASGLTAFTTPFTAFPRRRGLSCNRSLQTLSCILFGNSNSGSTASPYFPFTTSLRRISKCKCGSPAGFSPKNPINAPRLTV
jgi:hypothetical protein